MTHPYTDLKEAAEKVIADQLAYISGKKLKDEMAWHDALSKYRQLADPRSVLSLLADYERMREALEGLLNRYDPENPGDAMAPDGGCIECTVGTVPNNLNTGLCPMHRARAALKDNP